MRVSVLLLAGVILTCTIPGSTVTADLVSDVRNTRHNLSAGASSAQRSVKAVSESQICVFCHTPHGAENIPGAPLWNRSIGGGQTYTPYSSSSLDAQAIYGTLSGPAGSSKLCLSCHDGTLAIDTVNVINGIGSEGGVEIEMSGLAADGTMPPGSGATSGYTRDIGTDLTNDHPISLTYDANVALRDSELRVPNGEQVIFDQSGNRLVGVRDHGTDETLPLEATGPAGEGQIQCATCHDPHVRDTSGRPQKFLRANRFQEQSPDGGTYDSTDIICIACHEKDVGTAAWASSAHADPVSANEAYTTQASTQREFFDGIAVWQAACLNCHDTHTVQGARRLLREGTDNASVPKLGGGSAIEETCYQCHSSTGGTLVGQGNAGFAVPDIKSDFELRYHMPIGSLEQPAGVEVHDIGTGDSSTQGNTRGSNFVESRELLGRGNLQNRHAECTDCHNPHRARKNRLFSGAGDTVAGTHDHTQQPHSNLASGVLAGAWGVEPNYGADTGPDSFGTLPVGYDVKQGIPGNGTEATQPYVTREYQICLKCHSDYGYNTPPLLDGNAGNGRTAAGTNGMQQYTNQAMEFWPSYTTSGGNFRSFHPVIDRTLRNTTDRAMNGSAFLAPWGGANVGNQTMYCSDCHGSETGNGTAVPTGGENGNAWGPHGSSKPFILKGDWSNTTGRGEPDDLCFKCHDYNDYTNDRNDADNISGFCCDGKGNLHAFHQDRMTNRANVGIRCTWCHVAVPHGWKNKALLVNLNDVDGAVVDDNVLQCDPGSSNCGYTDDPYYLNARLKVVNWRASGTWRVQDCGNSGGGLSGGDWMRSVCAND